MRVGSFKEREMWEELSRRYKIEDKESEGVLDQYLAACEMDQQVIDRAKSHIKDITTRNIESIHWGDSEIFEEWFGVDLFHKGDKKGLQRELKRYEGFIKLIEMGGYHLRSRLE